MIPSPAEAGSETHPFPLTTLATSEPGQSGTHPHYLTDRTWAQKGCVMCPSPPVLRNGVWAPYEGLAQSPSCGELTMGTGHSQGGESGSGRGSTQEHG